MSNSANAFYFLLGVAEEGDVVSFNQQAYRSLDTNYHTS